MLKTLQQKFYQDVMQPDKTQHYLGNDNFSSSDLIKIYHHQYFFSLTAALKKTYSCVKRLVGEDFFNGLAKQFIKTQPLRMGNIIGYGHGFDDFIRHHPQCRPLPYLADIARFEWLYQQCYLFASTHYMHSIYPLIKIWQLDKNSDKLDLDSGGDYLKIYQQAQQVVVQRISKQGYEERQ